MQIACPNCSTAYQVADASLGPAGRSVRCVRCQNVWFTANPEALTAIARDHHSDVANFTASTSIASILKEPARSFAETAEAGEAAPAESDRGLELDDASPLEDVPAGGGLTPDAQPEPAEPIEVADSPPLAPGDEDAAPPPPEAPPREDIESIAARKRPPRKQRRPRRPTPGMFTAVLVLLAINTALLAFRADVVRFAPQTARIYAAIGLPVNLRGLAFSDVATERETHDGVQVLVVAGTLTNVTKHVVEVPRLRFAMRNDSGNEIYSWTALPSRSLLSPGETFDFRSRLASPPRDGQEVLVRFFNRRDLVAGIQ